MNGPAGAHPLQSWERHDTHMVHSPLVRLALVAILAGLVAGCAGRQTEIPSGTLNPDQFLMDQAEAAYADGDWLDAQAFYQQIVDNYPQSPLRTDARLGLANAYLGQGGAEALVLAAAEFRDFLQFFPTNPRADEAQFGLAMTHYEQMRAPERDQTETRAALTEFQALFDNYPQSGLMDEAQMFWREARDRLSESIYLVGYFYYNVQDWYPGAIARFEQVLEEDPDYTRRDAVYYYLAESLARTNRAEEAISYLERLLAEFDGSEHREDASQRLQELSIQ